MSRLTRDETAEAVSHQILRHVRGQGNIHFPCSADHEQDCGNLTRLIHTLAMCDDHSMASVIVAGTFGAFGVVGSGGAARGKRLG